MIEQAPWARCAVPSGCIAAQVVTLRGDHAAGVNYIGSRRSMLEDGVDQLQQRVIVGAQVQQATAAYRGRVAAEGRVEDPQRRRAARAALVADAAAVRSRVATQRRVDHFHRRAAVESVVVDAAAAASGRRVHTERRVAHLQARTAAGLPVVIDRSARLRRRPCCFSASRSAPSGCRGRCKYPRRSRRCRSQSSGR